MKCPVCADAETRVIDSRVIKEGAEIRRRRACESCAHRFTTYERAEGTFPMVVKKDGRREQWNRDKLLVGLQKACEKRPVPVDRIEKLADDIGREVGRVGDTEIAASEVGGMVMTRLRELDEVAYVRFASVYRSFKDIDEFMSELSDLIIERKNRGPGGDK